MRPASPCHARPSVTSFPRAALPAVIGTMRRSDSLPPVCLPPFSRLSGILARPRRQEAAGPPGFPCRRCVTRAVVFDPEEAVAALPLAAAPVVTSARGTASSFLIRVLSRLNPFTLSDYGPCACGPTLKDRDCSLTSKDSLPGGWLDLPVWDSHPLDFTTLPGRSPLVLLHYFWLSNCDLLAINQQRVCLVHRVIRIHNQHVAA